jgi:hypothetical protein
MGIGRPLLLGSDPTPDPCPPLLIHPPQQVCYNLQRRNWTTATTTREKQQQNIPSGLWLYNFTVYTTIY